MRLLRDQRGMVALETAVMLIAFVVTSAVFAVTIMSSGVLASDRVTQSTHAGVSRFLSSLKLVGAIGAQANSSHSQVITLSLTLKTLAGGTINLPDSSSGEGSMVISYRDHDEYHQNLDWSLSWATSEDGDNLLERGELALITIVLDGASNSANLTAGQEFSLQILSPQGSVLPILRQTPASLDGAMSL